MFIAFFLYFRDTQYRLILTHRLCTGK